MSILRTSTFLDNTFRTYNKKPLIYGFNDKPIEVVDDLKLLKEKGTLVSTKVVDGFYLYKRKDIEMIEEELKGPREEVFNSLITFILLKMSTQKPNTILRLPVGIYNTREPLFTHIQGLYTPNLHATFTQLVYLLNESQLASSISIETATGVRPLVDFLTSNDAFPEVTQGACFATTPRRLLGICLNIEVK